MDVEDENSVIPRIDPLLYDNLKTRGVVAAGMLPKLDNAFRSLHEGVSRVVICPAGSIAREGYGGTILTL